MVGSEFYDCRLAVWSFLNNRFFDYRILKVSSFGYSTKNEVKTIQPLMLRVFSTTLENVLGGLGKIQYGKGLPPIIIDFAQWSNTFDLTCYYSRNDKVMYQIMLDVNNIFTWIKNNQNTQDNLMYMQMFYNDADLTHKPKCALDPAKTVFGALEGYGYQGVVTSMNITNLDAGKGGVTFTLTFQHGMVVPI